MMLLSFAKLPAHVVLETPLRGDLCWTSPQCIGDLGGQGDAELCRGGGWVQLVGLGSSVSVHMCCLDIHRPVQSCLYINI